jgi:preprotein translocase subunit SecG
MKKYIKKLVVVIALCFLGILGLGELTQAEDKATETKGGFYYEVEFPENQRNKEGYLDLLMKPSDEQKVTVRLFNTSKNDMTIDVKLNGAKTNANGVIEYGPNAIEDDKSLAYKFTDLVKTKDSVKIPAGQSVNLELEITMPASSFDGTIAGGLWFQVKGNDDTQVQGTIVNKFAYVVAILLRENETPVEPDLALNKVAAGLNNFRNTVFINFSNIKPEYLNDMTTDVKITKKDSEAVLYDTKKSSMRMAPNSQITFPVSMDGQTMEAGKFVAHIVVTSGKKQWKWEKEFTITKEEADKFNNQDVNLVQDRGFNWKLILLIAIGAILVFVVIFILVTIARKKKQEAARAEKMRRRQQQVGKRQGNKRD